MHGSSRLCIQCLQPWYILMNNTTYFIRNEMHRILFFWTQKKVICNDDVCLLASCSLDGFWKCMLLQSIAFKKGKRRKKKKKMPIYRSFLFLFSTFSFSIFLLMPNQTRSMMFSLKSFTVSELWALNCCTNDIIWSTVEDQPTLSFDYSHALVMWQKLSMESDCHLRFPLPIDVDLIGSEITRSSWDAFVVGP